MVTKLGRVVTYDKGLPLIKVHNRSIRWFCEVTWQTNSFIYLLALDQWPPKMAR